MKCRDAHELIHGFVDSELGLVWNLEMEHHIHECPNCSGTHEGLRVMHTVLSGDALYFRPPAGVQERLRARLRKVSGVEGRARTTSPSWRAIGIAAAFAAAFVLCMAGIWQVAITTHNSSTTETIRQEVVASHVRSLMAAHLTDVPSSDQHTVKPWFNGKLDFSPVVADFAERGFALDGGRLDYLCNRAVAALVYRRRQHVINLFAWPTSKPARAIRTFDRQGYHVFDWTKDHVTYWAVSDLNPEELWQFAEMLRNSE
jgi:anti-sigma factor RsiW